MKKIMPKTPKSLIHLKLGQVCISDTKCRKVPHSPNRLNSMHWGERDRWKKAWQEEVWARWQEAKPKYTEILKLLPYKRATLEVSLFSVRPQDEDNAMASLKPIIDGLRYAGLIVDDDPARLRVKPITTIPIKTKGSEHLELTLRIKT